MSSRIIRGQKMLCNNLSGRLLNIEEYFYLTALLFGLLLSDLLGDIAQISPVFIWVFMRWETIRHLSMWYVSRVQVWQIQMLVLTVHILQLWNIGLIKFRQLMIGRHGVVKSVSLKLLLQITVPLNHFILTFVNA